MQMAPSVDIQVPSIKKNVEGLKPRSCNHKKKKKKKKKGK